MNSRFLALFAVTYLALYLGYSAIPQSLLSEKVYHYGIVRPSSVMINWLSPTEHVRGEDNTLMSAAARLSIVRGCDGSGVIFMLAAAIVGVRARLKWTVFGVLGAIAVVYGLNQLRIVALYFVASRWPSWFTPIHVYFIPTLMILVGSLYFAFWISHRYESEHTAPG